MSSWSNASNLAKVVFRRTYTRADHGSPETLPQSIERVILGNIRGHNVEESEVNYLRYLMGERKAGPAGRGWWFSGSPSHERLGGAALNNCWFGVASDFEVFVWAMDMLMLGGGVGLSVEHRYVSKLPQVKTGVKITLQNTKDADYIVPDSREGWCDLFRRILDSYFVTGKSFTYSTICVRGYGEKISGFGGTASGPIPLQQFVEGICEILNNRASRAMRPVDAADIICATGKMVVAGNVRRSAIIILGDPYDKVYLASKRWDLGIVPDYRYFANWSIVTDDIDDVHPSFWKTYEKGEPFGIINRTAIQKYGRIGEERVDSAVGVNPCAEATLEDREPCNLQEIFLPNLTDVIEFGKAARAMHRWGKRVTMEKYEHAATAEVIARNRRVGTGITGCLQNPHLFNPDALDYAYGEIQSENREYSKALGIPESIRTTVVKPSGTQSKCADVPGEGIHGAISRFITQRIRFAANDPLLPLLRAAGHYMEPQIKNQQTMELDHGTWVVDFYVDHGPDIPTVDQGFDTWQQLDMVKIANQHWADQSTSVTVYYQIEDIPKLKEWMRSNLQYFKTVSFLLAGTASGFMQLPKEPISPREYDKKTSKIKPIDFDQIGAGDIESQECAGACPVK